MGSERCAWPSGDNTGMGGEVPLKSSAKGIACLSFFLVLHITDVAQADGTQFKEPKIVRVDSTSEGSPDPEPSLPTSPEQAIESSPIRPATPPPILPAKRRVQEDLDADEYSSPAFVKRARVSYGSLFEGAFNIFDDDFDSGRGRKRTKFGRDSSAWRYTSQSRSPTPEEVRPEEEPSGQAEEPRVEAPEATPSRGPRESPRVPMTDEACQTSEGAPSPSASPSARRQGSMEAHEPSPTLDTAARTEEKFASPIHQQDASMSEGQRNDFGGIPLEPIPNVLNQVDIAAPHLQVEHGSLTNFQEQTLHPPGEPGIGSTFGGFTGEPIPWGSSAPYPTQPPPQGFQMDSFVPHQQPSLYPDLSQPFGSSFQEHDVPQPLPPRLGDYDTNAQSAQPPPQQQEPYIVSSDVGSPKSERADEGPSTGAEGEQQPMRLEENIKTLAPVQQKEDDGGDNVKDAVDDMEGKPEPKLMSRVDEDMDVESTESFPSDNDDGGDYDTQKYADLDDNDSDSDLESHPDEHGEVDEEEFHDEDEETYDQEVDYEDEQREEEEAEYEDWEEEEAAQPAAPPAPSAPVFIDLISDSEDEDEGPSTAVDQKVATGVEENDGEADTHQTTDAVEDGQSGEESGEEYSEGEGYSEEEGDAGSGSQEFEEAEDEYGDDEYDENLSVGAEEGYEETLSNAQFDGHTPTRQNDGSHATPPHTSIMADEGVADGKKDGEMVSKTEVVAVLSSPPPEGPSSPHVQAIDEPVPIEPAVTSPPTAPADQYEQHVPVAEAGPLERTDVVMIDKAQDDVVPATEPRGPTPSPDTEARKSSTQDKAPDVNPEAVGPASKTDVRIPSPAVETDVQMASPAAEPAVPHPAPPSDHGAPEPEPMEKDQEDHAETVAVATESARISLDDEVQADIERQMEETLIAAPEDADVTTDDAPESRKEKDGVQPHDEAQKGKEVSKPPGPEALASPPLTQTTQSQVDVNGATHGESTAAGRPEADQLLTPNATQLASASQSFEEVFTMPDRRESTEATKITLGSPTREPDASEAKATPERPGRTVTSPTTESFTSQATEDATQTAPPGSAEGFAITIKSLRSRRHGRSASVDKQESPKRDPSTRLARDSLAARERGSAKRDPSVQLAKDSAARRGSAVETTPQMTGRTTRSKTRSVQMSASPEPLLRSPELGDAIEPEKESQSILKLQLNKNLRLSLLDLTALKVLRTNVNRTIDVLGVATAQPASPQRPKHGPRDYLLHLTIADQTTAPNSVVAVQVFRPHIESLPVVREGDVVLLRQFTVTGVRGRDFGLRSCDTSSWAVWEKDRDDGLPQIKGPPVEVSGDEQSQAGLLLKWYAGLDGRAKEKLGRANAKMGQG